MKVRGALIATMFRFLWILLLVGVSNSKPAPDFVMDYTRKHPYTGVNNAASCHIFGEPDDTNEMGAESIIALPSRRWSNNIVYYTITDPSYSSNEIALIEAALRDIEEKTRVNGKTCIQFAKRTTQSNYVYVESGAGCGSYLGMIGGAQLLALDKSCLYHGVIVHEFLHALGFQHEHQRADRDEYIDIIEDHILPVYLSQFRKLEEGTEIDHLGTPYDYASIMHYGVYEAAIDRYSPTIIPHDPDAEIGLMIRLSNWDIKRIQIAYKCI